MHFEYGVLIVPENTNSNPNKIEKLEALNILEKYHRTTILEKPVHLQRCCCGV